MLGKLIKYEFKSTWRTFAAVYSLLFAFALLTRFSLAGMDGPMFRDNKYMQVLFGIIVFAYVMIIFSALILTFVVIVQRFYKNLTGDEGYLMHTLPVSTHSLIQAKVVTAFVWETASVFAVILSLFALFFQPSFISAFADFMRELGELLRMGVDEIGVLRVILDISAMILLGVVSVVCGTLTIYASISIGHTFKKHRIFGAVAAYLALSMIAQTISGFVTAGVGMAVGNVSMPLSSIAVNNMFFGIFGFLLILNIGFACAWYFVTSHVLSSQLNLE